jgi:hypothetical protein
MVFSPVPLPVSTESRREKVVVSSSVEVAALKLGVSRTLLPLTNPLEPSCVPAIKCALRAPARLDGDSDLRFGLRFVSHVADRE